MHSITTFANAHPGVPEGVVSAILAEDMSSHVTTAESLLQGYVERHLDELRTAVAKYAG